MDDVTEEIIREAKRIEEDAQYSAKGHFEAARMLSTAHYWLGIPAGVFAAVAGASAFTQFDNHGTIAGILSIIVLALTAVTTFLNPNEKAHAHLSAGNRYNALRNQARIFRTVDAQLHSTPDELSRRLKELAKERDDLNERSPQIPRLSFLWARKGIEQGETQYAVDKANNQPLSGPEPPMS